MAVRKFWLINGQGKKYDLTDFKDAFLNTPTGLGSSNTVTVTRLGNSQKLNSVTDNLEVFGGELLFQNSEDNALAYDSYNVFVRFISILPLYFHYQTPAMSNENYYREVVMNSIEKGEVDEETGLLRCNVSFTPLTMWKNDNQTVVEAGAAKNTGKKYKLNRKYSYSSASYEDIKLINNSPLNVPMEIEIIGRCKNPSFTLYDRSGSVYGVCRLIGTFDYVYINSDDRLEEIKLSLDDAWLNNAVNYQDFTVGIPNQAYLTFCYLKPGTSGMKFTFAEEFDGYVRVGWRDEYATV